MRGGADYCAAHLLCLPQYGQGYWLRAGSPATELQQAAAGYIGLGSHGLLLRLADAPRGDRQHGADDGDHRRGDILFSRGIQARQRGPQQDVCGLRADAGGGALLCAVCPDADVSELLCHQQHAPRNAGHERQPHQLPGAQPLLGGAG